jgi:hypothetical protein
METNHFSHLSPGQPTYWPSDLHKIPDIVDFCVTKDIPPDFAVAQSCLDLSSDHSPVLVTLTSQALHKDPPPSLCNYFSYLIHQRLTPHVPLKTPNDVEDAVKFFTDTVVGRVEGDTQTSRSEQNPRLSDHNQTKTGSKTETPQRLAAPPNSREQTAT